MKTITIRWDKEGRLPEEDICDSECPFNYDLYECQMGWAERRNHTLYPVNCPGEGTYHLVPT